LRILQNLILLAAVAGFVAGTASGAKADVVWTVSGTFDDNTTLTGTFTTNVYGFLENNYSLTTQTDTPKGFVGFTYTSSNSYFSNGTFYVDFQPGYQQDLHLAFLDGLSVPNLNNPIVGASGDPATGPSYECQGSFSCFDLLGGTVRFIGVGFASSPVPGTNSVTSGIPEASTWAMLLLGFAGIGFLGYRRSNRRPNDGLRLS
jgi:hypothetical protein